MVCRVRKVKKPLNKAVPIISKVIRKAAYTTLPSITVWASKLATMRYSCMPSIIMSNPLRISWAGKIANQLEIATVTIPNINRHLYFHKYLFRYFSAESFKIDVATAKVTIFSCQVPIAGSATTAEQKTHLAGECLKGIQPCIQCPLH